MIDDLEGALARDSHDSESQSLHLVLSESQGADADSMDTAQEDIETEPQTFSAASQPATVAEGDETEQQQETEAMDFNSSSNSVPAIPVLAPTMSAAAAAFAESSSDEDEETEAQVFSQPPQPSADLDVAAEASSGDSSADEDEQETLVMSENKGADAGKGDGAGSESDGDGDGDDDDDDDDDEEFPYEDNDEGSGAAVEAGAATTPSSGSGGSQYGTRASSSSTRKTPATETRNAMKDRMQKYGGAADDLFASGEDSDEEFIASSGGSDYEDTAVTSSKGKPKKKVAREKTDKQLSKEKMERHRTDAKLLREQTDLTLKAKEPVRRNRSRTPAIFAFAKPALPHGRTSSSSSDSNDALPLLGEDAPTAAAMAAMSAAAPRLGRRASFLRRLPEAVLKSTPTLLGGARFVSKGKHGQFNANSLLQTSDQILLLDTTMSNKQQKKSFLKIDQGKKVVSAQSRRLGGRQVSMGRTKALRKIKKQINRNRTAKVMEDIQMENEDEERGYASAGSQEMGGEELDGEEGLADAEAGDEEEGADADGGDGDGMDEAADPAANAEAAEDDDDNDELNKEVARVSTPNLAAAADGDRNNARDSMRTPIPSASASTNDLSAGSDGNINPAAFFGAQALQITAVAKPAAVSEVKRRLSSDGEPGTPGLTADGRPASPVFGTPNHRNHTQTPELFGQGTPQAYSPYLTGVERPRAERSSSASSTESLSADRRGGGSRFGGGKTYGNGRRLSSSGGGSTPNSALRYPNEDSQDMYGGQAQPSPGGPRALSGAFTPLDDSGSSQQSQYLDENGLLQSRQASRKYSSSQGGDSFGVSSHSFDSMSQGLGGSSQSGSQEDMAELLDLCSGVFAEAEDVVQQEPEPEEVEEEEEDDETLGFFVDEAEVSGDSDDEEAILAEQAADAKRKAAAKAAAAGEDADEDLLDELDDSDVSDGEVMYGMPDDEDDEELAMMKARFLKNSGMDEDDLADKKRKRVLREQKDALAQQEDKVKRKAARKERKRLKKERRKARKAAKKAEQEQLGSDDDMFATSDTEEQTFGSIDAFEMDDEEAAEIAAAQKKIDANMAKQRMLELHCRPEDELSTMMAESKKGMANRIINTNTSNSMSAMAFFSDKSNAAGDGSAVQRRASHSSDGGSSRSSSITSPGAAGEGSNGSSNNSLSASTSNSASLWKASANKVISAQRFLASAKSPSARPPLRRRGSYLAKDEAQKKTLKEFAKPPKKKAASKKGQAYAFKMSGGPGAPNDGSSGGKKRAFGSVGQNKYNSSSSSSGDKKLKTATKTATKTPPANAEPARPRTPSGGRKSKFAGLFNALKRQNTA